MGQCLSLSIEYDGNPVNAMCPVCKETKKLPNLNGRFFVINDEQCLCNSCNTIFPKSQFYKS
jgi:hypothetical protein